jgi:hypothetical protein
MGETEFKECFEGAFSSERDGVNVRVDATDRADDERGAAWSMRNVQGRQNTRIFRRKHCVRDLGSLV